MICKKYSAQYKIEKVQEYLKEKETKKITKAEFAERNGISDSTFNDWVLKYQRQGKGFCNITNEIVKLEEVEIVDTEKCMIRKLPEQYESIEGKTLGEEYVRLTYNGAVIEFNKILLEKVMGIIKKW